MADDPAPSLEALLRRDRLIAAAGLAVLCFLAWGYLLSGAGLGMSPWRLSRLALFPHQFAAPGAAGMALGSAPSDLHHGPFQAWALVSGMWFSMMVAMMTPTAAPAILLYARVSRQALAEDDDSRLAPTGAFAAGYLLSWLELSLAAASGQWALQNAGLSSAATMSSQSRWLSAGILIAAGLYQLSPLQDVCLKHCRSPVEFLTRHWGPGVSGALRLGMMHGLYCVGCCWLLMALLFVGGVMNLAWIALLSLLVAAEKNLPGGRWLARAAGVVLVAWGAATLRA